MIDSGRLIHSVKLVSFSKTKQPNGELLEIENTPLTRWCEIRPKSGARSYLASKHTERTTHEITLRYEEKLLSTTVVRFGARIFEIEAFLNSYEKNEELIIFCREDR